MPSVTDWISSIGSLVGALTGIGALVVAVLSYRRSSRALAADARTRGAVASTVDAVEALSRAGGLDAEPRDERPTLRPQQPGGEHARSYAAAVADARRRLDRN